MEMLMRIGEDVQGRWTRSFLPGGPGAELPVLVLLLLSMPPMEDETGTGAKKAGKAGRLIIGLGDGHDGMASIRTCPGQEYLRTYIHTSTTY